MIKDGLFQIKPGVKITAAVETKKSVKYIRVGQLSADGKIEGLGRMFYVSNAGGSTQEWELKHISEGQCDGPRSGFGRYFEEEEYYHIGWYHKNMHNGYILNVVKGVSKEGVEN